MFFYVSILSLYFAFLGVYLSHFIILFLSFLLPFYTTKQGKRMTLRIFFWRNQTNTRNWHGENRTWNFKRNTLQCFMLARWPTKIDFKQLKLISILLLFPCTFHFYISFMALSNMHKENDLIQCTNVSLIIQSIYFFLKKPINKFYHACIIQFRVN